MFFKCPSWLCKELGKAQELLLLVKKNLLKAYNYPELYYVYIIVIVLCTTLRFPFFYYLILIITSTAYAQHFIGVTSGNSLTPHTLVWAKRVQNTVLN